MFRRRGFALVIFSLCMGGVAAWAANDWVNDRLSVAEEGGQPVVVAALDIPYGTKIEGRHLRIAQLPSDSIPTGSFVDLKQVNGKVARYDLSRGETIMASRVADHVGGSTLAALVQENMRAVTVRVDDVVGVAGFLLPGNRVDVLATKMHPGSRNARTDTILKNIKVLAVDQTAATQENEPVIVRAVTLEMTPTQSEVIVKAKSEGSIQLTLRNPLEEQLAQPEPPKAKKAPKIAVRPATVKRKASTDTTVTVIRGTQVDKFKTKS